MNQAKYRVNRFHNNDNVNKNKIYYKDPANLYAKEKKTNITKHVDANGSVVFTLDEIEPYHTKEDLEFMKEKNTYLIEFSPIVFENYDETMQDIENNKHTITQETKIQYPYEDLKFENISFETNMTILITKVLKNLVNNVHVYINNNDITATMMTREKKTLPSLISKLVDESKKTTFRSKNSSFVFLAEITKITQGADTIFQKDTKL